MQVYMGGMAPTSTVSWRKSSSIVIYLTGCDFRCANCNTPEFIDFKQEFLFNVIDVKREINKHAGFVQSAFFSGGEPCLQRQPLLNLARHCKEIGLDIGLETNGTKPETIQSLLQENILDFIEIDLKSPFEEDIFESITNSKNFFKPTSQIIQSVKDTLSLVKKHDNKLSITFRTLIVPDISDDLIFLKKIGESINDIRCSWKIIPFNNEKVLKKSFSTIQKPEEAKIEFLKEELKKMFPTILIE